MNWKDFFKPTTGKVVLFLILMIVLNYYLISTIVVADAVILVGTPLGFYPVGSMQCLSPSDCPSGPEFSYVNLIIDIVFWYVVSCIIVFIYKKARRKSG